MFQRVASLRAGGVQPLQCLGQQDASIFSLQSIHIDHNTAK